MREARERMRDFEDAGGGQWEVVVGRESWGVFYALFVPKGGPPGRQVRRTLLEETSQVDASRVVMSWSEGKLAELFRESRIEDDES